MQPQRARIAGFVVFVAVLIAIAYCSLSQPQVTIFDSPIPRAYLPMIAKNYRYPDLRFGVAEHSTSEMAILGLPEDGRYHTRQRFPIEPSNSGLFLRTAHRTHAPSRWCTGAYAFAGRDNYCLRTQEIGTASLGDWVVLDLFSYWVQTHPGKVYIIGNELLCPEPCGDAVTAEQYAEWYHEAWMTIKALDPTAKIGPYGPIGSADGREMVEDVWDAYLNAYGAPMPVDFYPVHWYPWFVTWDGSLLAAEIAALEEHVAWFESYRGIKWTGPQDYWLTEYGLPTWVYEIPGADLLLFMEQFTMWLMTNDSHISCWAWWPAGEAALVAAGARTALGDCYYNLAVGQACE